MGAAIPGGVITGDVKDVVLLDVTLCHSVSKQWVVSSQNSLTVIQPFQL
jgi:hypothetical protein